VSYNAVAMTLKQPLVSTNITLVRISATVGASTSGPEGAPNLRGGNALISLVQIHKQSLLLLLLLE
jgi:hypothetical protein